MYGDASLERSDDCRGVPHEWQRQIAGGEATAQGRCRMGTREGDGQTGTGTGSSRCNSLGLTLDGDLTGVSEGLPGFAWLDMAGTWLDEENGRGSSGWRPGLRWRPNHGGRQPLRIASAVEPAAAVLPAWGSGVEVAGMWRVHGRRLTARCCD